ncbi:hypothetical protein M2318_005129 [Metapseudomonas resinovorans]|uniref:hypothetical protein n=1 Tax=Metapseudomonas resinovorans TaxID=53412 RepID=UPI003D1EA74A
MAVKGKRAKALPLLDTATGLATGELVDESISANAEVLVQSFNGEFGGEFMSWLKSRLGTFRAMHELPATHEERREVLAALLALQEAIVRPDNLPPVADGEMEHQCLNRYKQPYKGPGGLLSEFTASAEKMVLALEATDERLESLPVTRGRKATSNRDQLLADVAAYVTANSTSKKRTTKRRAAEVARDVLAAADVNVPDDLYLVEKLIRQQKSGEK